jgi:hypothetical protein
MQLIVGNDGKEVHVPQIVNMVAPFAGGAPKLFFGCCKGGGETALQQRWLHFLWERRRNYLLSKTPSTAMQPLKES